MAADVELMVYEGLKDPERDQSIAADVGSGIYCLWTLRKDAFWPSALNREAIQALRDLGGHSAASLAARLWLLLICRADTPYRNRGKPVLLRMPKRFSQVVRELFPEQTHGEHWQPSIYYDKAREAASQIFQLDTCGHRIVQNIKRAEIKEEVQDFAILVFPEKSGHGPKIDVDKLMILGQRSKIGFFMALEASLWFGQVNVRVKRNKAKKWYQVRPSEDTRTLYQISKQRLMEWSQRNWRDTKRALKHMEDVGFSKYDGRTLVPGEDWTGWPEVAKRFDVETIAVKA